jgi:hypothetical protein
MIEAIVLIIFYFVSRLAQAQANRMVTGWVVLDAEVIAQK